MNRSTPIVLTTLVSVLAATAFCQVPEDVRRKLSGGTTSTDVPTPATRPASEGQSAAENLRQAQEIDSRLAGELGSLDRDFAERKKRLLETLRAAAATQPAATKPSTPVAVQGNVAVPTEVTVTTITADTRNLSPEAAKAIVVELRTTADALDAQLKANRGTAVTIDAAVQVRLQQLELRLRDIRQGEQRAAR